MSILENAFVRGYFEVDKCLGTGNPPEKCSHKNCMALRVLAAMEAEINKGDMILMRSPKVFDRWEVCAADFINSGKDLHDDYLRLPDRWQREKETRICFVGNCQCDCHQESKPGPVEAKIEEIMQAKVYGKTLKSMDDTLRYGDGMGSMLRDLVKLARETT